MRVLLGVVCALVLAPAVAEAEVVWLCHPSIVEDPCEIELDTTTREPGGGETISDPVRPPRDERPVDCFYVYPTVSNQLSANADKSRDPELESIAKYQAARFSTQCRMFAPIYRQGTLAALAGASTQDQATIRKIAYSDVEEAWRHYLATENGGRGVVLLGHSQGTRMLRALIRHEIDRRPEVRRLLVGAVLLGGNVTVAAGRTTGGDFENVPTCTQPAEVGCVVAYSSFPYDPPEDSRYGRPEPPPDEGLGLPGGAGLRIACTDPGPLSSDTEPFGITVPSEPFAFGPIFAGIVITSGGPPPSAPTTWVQTADRYQGTCETANGADVLRYAPVGDSRRPNFFPDDTWGTHLIDVNLGIDRLVAIVAAQARHWTAPQLELTRRCAGRRVRAAVDGPDVALVREVSFKVGKRSLGKDRSAPFARRFAAAPRRGRLTAVATMRAGSSERIVLRRALPRCGR